LATDFDGTIAREDRVRDDVIDALRRLRISGRRILLVTGRQIANLRSVFPQMDIFDCIVAENGGVLFWPESRSLDALAPPPSPMLLDALHERGIEPLSAGSVVVATRHPNEHAVLDVIHGLALELQIVFNQNEVMVLPPGVSKGTGLQSALRKLNLSEHEVVSVGNAANDHSFLTISECSVAVADAAPSIRDAVTFTTRSPNGDGVIELIEELIDNDLASRTPMRSDETVLLGIDERGDPIRLSPYGHNILVVGPSASGKSTFATGVIERLMDLAYQLCIIDPEGDYGTLEGVTVLGSRARAPAIDEVVEVLRDPGVSVVVNLLGVRLEDRPHFAADLFSQIHAMRVSTGRPHWVVVDEVHHLLPSSWAHAKMLLPQRLGETILITMRATEVVPHLVERVDVIVAVGSDPQAVLDDVAAALGTAPPEVPPLTRSANECVIWFRARDRKPMRMWTVPARTERLRHIRKYAEGNLGAKSFFFRGPEQRFNLRAQNLASFRDLIEGIDDATFLHHLNRGDYSAWLRSAIKDAPLAEEVSSIRSSGGSTAQKRRAIIEAIEQRYVVGR
ncbi:MAG TPA: HAD hydrolase family protein, partial [Thermoanaerobaculia bacterium]|nr:HAD hydrolase family protein [Thermoanaerobaculia bacterium]